MNGMDARRLDPIRIFVSYSHLDRKWFSKLTPLLVFEGPMLCATAFHDNQLTAGDNWESAIKIELRQMDIFLCLLSYQFLASEFIRDVELEEAFKREKAGQCLIVPLLLNEMDERDLKNFMQFNPLPAWGRSWRSYEKRGKAIDAHKPIRTGLLDVIEKVNAKRRSIPDISFS